MDVSPAAGAPPPLALYDLGTGEHADVSLAFELRNSLMLPDDTATRTPTAELSVMSIGMRGILRLTKERMHISERAPSLEDFERYRLCITDTLLPCGLQLVGE